MARTATTRASDGTRRLRRYIARERLGPSAALAAARALMLPSARNCGSLLALGDWGPGGKKTKGGFGRPPLSRALTLRRPALLCRASRDTAQAIAAAIPTGRSRPQLAAGLPVAPTIALALLAQPILVEARRAQLLAHAGTAATSAVALILHADAAGADLNRWLRLRNGRIKSTAR